MSLAVKEHLSLDTVFSALHQFGSSFASLDLLRLRVILDIFFWQQLCRGTKESNTLVDMLKRQLLDLGRYSLDPAEGVDETITSLHRCVDMHRISRCVQNVWENLRNTKTHIPTRPRVII